MRKVIVAVVVLVVLIVAAMLALPFFIDINQYRGEIQTQLQERLRRPVQFGAMSLATFPLRVKVKDVIIGDDPRFQRKVPFAQVGEMDVSLKLLPLLTKSVSISSLTLARPQIELIKDAAGVWNFARIGQAPEVAAPVAPVPAPAKPSSPSPAPTAPPTSSGSEFSLDELKITDGLIAVTDLQQKQPRSVYDHIDLTLSDFAPGKPFALDLTAHLPGAGARLAAHPP